MKSVARQAKGLVKPMMTTLDGNLSLGDFQVKPSKVSTSLMDCTLTSTGEELVFKSDVVPFGSLIVSISESF